MLDRLPHLYLLVLLASIFATGLLSAAHQAEIGIWPPGSTYELTAPNSDSNRAASTETTGTAPCAAESACHVQLVLARNAFGDDIMRSQTGYLRPGPGSDLTSRAIDVMIPPPMAVRA